MLTNTIHLTFTQFQKLTKDITEITKFTEEAQLKICEFFTKYIRPAETVEIDLLKLFSSSIETNTVDLYSTDKLRDGIAGELLDLVLCSTELAAKVDIPLSEEHPDYDENMRDIDYLNKHHKILITDSIYMNIAIKYFNEYLMYPYIKLPNGNWLGINAVKENYSLLN